MTMGTQLPQGWCWNQVPSDFAGLGDCYYISKYVRYLREGEPVGGYTRSLYGNSDFIYHVFKNKRGMVVAYVVVQKDAGPEIQQFLEEKLLEVCKDWPIFAPGELIALTNAFNQARWRVS